MSFLQPVFLWALAGISVPIAIHLLSRREGKVVKIGSLRHVEESNTSRFKSLKLNELWLLLARCLMIAWLAMFLSGAQCTNPGTAAGTKWLLIEAGMHKDSHVASLIDSLTGSGFELRLLAENFPEYDEEDSLLYQDYWNISENLKSKPDHEIVVLSYSYIRGFSQKRPTLSPHITWITVDGGQKDYLHSARRIGDSVAVRIGHSDAIATSYTSLYPRSQPAQSSFTHPSFQDPVMIEPEDTISVFIASEKEFTSDVSVLRATLTAIQRTCAVHIRESGQEDAHWTFWFTGRKRENTGRNFVVLEPQPSTELIRRTSRSEWVITKRLTPEEAVESHLATELAALLLGADAGIDPNDRRVMPEKMAWAEAGDLSMRSVEAVPVKDLSRLLLLLFALTWMAERAMAVRKNL